jgi:hypothetical protein
MKVIVAGHNINQSEAPREKSKDGRATNVGRMIGMCPPSVTGAKAAQMAATIRYRVGQFSIERRTSRTMKIANTHKRA